MKSDKLTPSRVSWMKRMRNQEEEEGLKVEVCFGSYPGLAGVSPLSALRQKKFQYQKPNLQGDVRDRNNATINHKMLYLVGLGLADETDITVKGLEVVKKAERVYLEAYTAILLVDKEQLVCEAKSSSMK